MVAADRTVGEMVSLLRSVMYVGPALDALPPGELKLLAAEFRALLVADPPSVAERIVGRIGTTAPIADAWRVLPATTAASVTAALRTIVQSHEVGHPT